MATTTICAPIVYLSAYVHSLEADNAKLQRALVKARDLIDKALAPSASSAGT